MRERERDIKNKNKKEKRGTRLRLSLREKKKKKKKKEGKGNRMLQSIGVTDSQLIRGSRTVKKATRIASRERYIGDISTGASN